MATIKERAEEYATNAICIKHEGKKVLACEKLLQGCTSCKIKAEAFKQYVKFATEQDRISRQEERERFIDEICDFMRNFTLPNGVAPLYDYVGNVRKAMEGGEV